MRKKTDVFSVVRHPTLGSRGVFLLKIQKNIDKTLLDISSRLIAIELQKPKTLTQLQDSTLFKLSEDIKIKQIQIKLNRNYSDVEIKRLGKALSSLSRSNIFPRPLNKKKTKTFLMFLFLGDQIVSEVVDSMRRVEKPGSMAEIVKINMAKTAMLIFKEYRYDLL
ncbi:MAG: hypothetical protein PHE67_00085 [Campylobacterales bacterium]|nr:hypothetical protein [Campylobacterales bacterium]